MNLIDHLHSTVTPKILPLIHHHGGDEVAKRGALSDFFALFGVRLSNPNILSDTKNLSSDDLKDGSRLLDVIFKDDEGNTQTQTLNDGLATQHQLPKQTVDALTIAATPAVYEELNSLASTGSVITLLQDNMESLVAYLPSWAEKLLPLGLLAGAANLTTRLDDNLIGGAKHLSNDPQLSHGTSSTTPDALDTVEYNGANPSALHESPTAIHVNDQVEPLKTAQSSFAKSLLPIIGLVIFAGLAWLLLRACQESPTPVAAPVATPTQTTTVSPTNIHATPATFSLATDDTGTGIYSCHGEAGSEGVFASIGTALLGVFGGSENTCNLNVVSGVSDTLPASEHLSGIFGFMRGVPNASVSISDKVVRFNAANSNDLAKLIDSTKNLLPADFVVEAEPQLDVASAVSSSITTAKTAITGLTDTATADDLVRALNLQIINFATASSEIPAENKEILDLAVAKLTHLPNVKLNIIGHTDSQGSHSSNQSLSEQRAKAVHDYLVSKGVPDERLEIFGASFDRPIATNATEQGRFQNRRIEFALIKDGEQINVVDGQTTPTSDATSKTESQ